MPSKSAAKQAKKAAVEEVKKVKPVKKAESSSDDDSSSSEEETQTKTVGKVAAVKQPVKRPADESSDSDSDSESSEDEKKSPAKKPAVQPAAKKNGVKKESSSSDDSDSSEDEKPAVNNKAAAKPAAAKKDSDSDSSSDDDEDDNKKVAAAKAKPAVVKEKATKKKEESSSSSDDDSDDADDPKVAAVAASKQKPATKTAKKDESSSSDDDDSDDDDDDTAKAKPVQAKTAKKEDSDDDSDEEDDDDDDETPAAGQKRKAAGAMETPAKKVKVEDGGAGQGQELFIRGLPLDVEEKKLKKFLTKLNVPVSAVRLFPGKNFCYADLSEAMDADAVGEINGKSFDGNELLIEIARQRQDKKGGNTPGSARGGRQMNGGDRDERDSRTLFIGNLSWSTTMDSIQEHFPGAVDARLPMNEEGKPKGFGFVEFGSEKDAEKALNDLNGSELDGRNISLDYVGAKSTKGKGAGGRGGFDRGGRGGRGGPRGGGSHNNSFQESAPNKSLIVKNLAYSTTSDSLQEAFDGALSARVLMCPEDPNRSRGLGFVDFDSVEDAQKALKSMQGQAVDGRQVKIDFATPRRDGGGRGGRGGRGGGNDGARQKHTGAIQDFQGKKKKFNEDSD